MKKRALLGISRESTFSSSRQLKNALAKQIFFDARVSSKIHLQSQFCSRVAQKINFVRDFPLAQLKPPPFHQQKDHSLDFSDKELKIVR